MKIAFLFLAALLFSVSAGAQDIAGIQRRLKATGTIDEALQTAIDTLMAKTKFGNQNEIRAAAAQVARSYNLTLIDCRHAARSPQGSRRRRT